MASAVASRATRDFGPSEDETAAAPRVAGRGDWCLAPIAFPIILNSRWCVIDDPLQWILAVRQRENSNSGNEYRHRSFCASRSGLLRCIDEYIVRPGAAVDPDALDAIYRLPEMHPDDRTEALRRRAG